jgi:microcystin-dependent protein
MSNPYVGEIRMFAGNFEPAGWMFCQGQLLPISEYDTLFQLIGTTYGGDGQSTFALPDCRGRLPLHNGTLSGNTFILGELGGVEQVALSVQQIPTHTHVPACFSETGGIGDQQSPVGNYWSATSTGDQIYELDITPSGTMNATLIGSTGGSVPHENIGPYLCVNFIISLFGVFPTPT